MRQPLELDDRIRQLGAAEGSAQLGQSRAPDAVRRA
jgi:hypothetical protein